MSDTGSIIQTVGSIASLATGNPAFYLAAMAISAVFFPPEPQKVEGPRLSDLKVQSSSYGKEIPIIYGASRVAGNILWLKNNEIEEVRIVTEEGGKGGGGGQEIVTYEYYATVAIGVCEGPITGIRRIWADSILIYSNETPTDVVDAVAQVNASQDVTIYLGTSDQEPNELIEADRGTAPAYRNLAYVVFRRFALKKYGNRIPNFTFEVVDGISQQVQLATYPFTRSQPGAAQEAFGNSGYNLDRNFHAYVYYPMYTTEDPRDNDIIHWYRMEFDGRETFLAGTTITGTHTLALVERYRHGDVPFFATVRGGNSNDYNVHSWSITNSAVGSTGYYNSAGSFPAGPLPGVSDKYCIRNGVLFRNSFVAGYGIYTAPFPAGGAASRVTETLFIAISGLTGASIVNGGMDSDGTNLWVISDAGANACRLHKVDIATKTEVAYYDLGTDVWNDVLYDPDTGYIYLQEFTDVFAQFKPATEEFEVLSSISLGTNSGEGDAWGIRDGLLQIMEGAPVSGTTTERRWYSFESLENNDVNVSTIISDLCTRSGLSASQINVAGITDTTAGFVHTKRTGAQNSLEVLARSYHFDAVDSAYKIKFVSRGGASAVTLTNDDLAAHEYGQERPEEIEIARERDISIPRRIDVAFIDEDREYDPGTQYAERIVPNSDGIQNVELAIVLSTTEAAAIAEVLLYETWMSRITFQFSLPMQYSYLEPTDVVTLNLNEGLFTCRILETEFGAGLIRCRGVLELSTVYNSDAAGEPGTGYTQTLKYIVDTKLKLLDMPIMQDANDDAGFYVAAGPEVGYTFDGAQLYISNDEGETYSNFDAVINESIIGYTTDALADGEWYVFDRVNSVNVRLYNNKATLSSVTELQALNNSNVCIIGQDQRWEVLHFVNATLEGDGTYTLDTLLRGKRGSEPFMHTHVAGDCFVLLTEAALQRYNFGIDLIGLERYYKGVTFGKNLFSAETVIFTNNAVGLKPYAPVNISGSRDGSDNLTITWNRRTRIGGEWRDLVDASLGETTEAYEVEILQESSPTAVLRTISVSSETASYTAAQQTTDFGSTQSAVIVNVYQISATVGRGYVGTATV